MRKNVDIHEFKKVLLLSEEYFQQNINSLFKPSEILFALVEDTLRQLNEDISNVNIVFDYLEIHNLVWPCLDKSEAANASKKVRDHRKKIFELLAEEGDLSKFLKERNIDIRLTFESDDSKGGTTTKMWLGLTDSNENLKNSSSGVAIYKAIDLKKPFFWVQPMTNTTLKGWGVLAFLSIPVCVVLGIPFLLFSISKVQSSIFAVFAVIVMIMLWRFGYIIYELITKGVASAPDWMVRLSEQNALFTVSRETSTDKEGRRHKIIELVVYEAECPTCKDSLYIENGGKEFNGRYVGKCALAPSEHVFTFDHITKRGKLAR
jgi:hypothetical protein